jgi:chaperonin GroES
MKYTPGGQIMNVRLDVKAGDLILFGKYSGQEIKLAGKEYLIMKEDEVLAVSDGAPARRGARVAI